VKASFALLLLLAIAATACSGGGKPAAEPDAGAAAAPAPNEDAALDALRRTNEAQSTYLKINRRYALTYDELIEARLLSDEPSSAQIGYDFNLRPAADAESYKLYADPNGNVGRRFFTDQTGVIRSENGKSASVDSPQVQ
jgi:hypothetical protein